ncbi:YcnI family protein [Mycolicibacterium sp. CBMA 226]|uniref:YcnI family protein n=1 Tax=Mycolicibacterium sp. CBMA 226 TaxID=2606611 RepID=UPI0012DEE654|nr:YcnI family protein [Mycolicibacterium sp. CBMA 226]MUL79498.1 YcnI family protein [Mycolicibacterium sp. CBMA 226]
MPKLFHAPKPFRAIVALTATTACAVALAAPAAAHVKVTGDATQGGWGVLNFRVPTESDTASTTALLVVLPDDQPIISVSTQQKAGWTATLNKKKLATPQKDDDGAEVTEYVSSVEWKATAPDAPIPPHQFNVFAISAGPLPKVTTLSLPAVQTYSDGKTVNWNEKANPGQPEPEHPAPTLHLKPAGGGDHDQPAAAPAPTTPAWPGLTALAVSVVALLLGIANLATSRRKTTSRPEN